MDTSETYIKMCDCEEIRGLWNPAKGDWIVEKNLRDFPEVIIEGLRDGDFVYEIGWDSNEHLDEDEAIWLPRQDQLQAMVNDNINYTIQIQGFDEMLEFTGGHSWEQLWLRFIMKHKYNKAWVDNKWVNV